MIDIKFRIYDKINNRMFYWTKEFQEYDLKVALSVPKRFDVMQYIGLQDINKKDIYEGDLLKSKDGKINTVVWSNKLSGYILGIWLKTGKQKDLDIKTLEEKIVDCTYFIADEDEIIGNIKENFELIGEKV